MSRDHEIKTLTEVALLTQVPEVKMRLMDTLALYGREGIAAIAEVLAQTVTPDVKNYGVYLIKRLEQKEPK